MSAGDELFSVEKSILFTFKGRVTVFFMDGYSLDGELIQQDLFNIYLLVDDQPRMIPRSQIRYIQGRPGQQPVPDIASLKAFSEIEPVQTDLADLSAFDTAAMASPRLAADQLETDLIDVAAQAGIEAGTFAIEPEAAQTGSDTHGDLAELADTPLEPLEDTDVTFVLPDSAELIGEVVQSAASAEDWDDVTMVLAQEEEAEDDVTAVLPPEQDQAITTRFICQSGPHAGEQFEFKSEVITLGRARDNDVPLYLDKEISRRHAVIKLEHGRFVIQDQNSLNGTYVNNERVEAPRPLQDGDIIFVGVSDIVYREE